MDTSRHLRPVTLHSFSTPRYVTPLSEVVTSSCGADRESTSCTTIYSAFIEGLAASSDYICIFLLPGVNSNEEEGTLLEDDTRDSPITYLDTRNLSLSTTSLNGLNISSSFAFLPSFLPSCSTMYFAVRFFICFLCSWSKKKIVV